MTSDADATRFGCCCFLIISCSQVTHMRMSFCRLLYDTRSPLAIVLSCSHALKRVFWPHTVFRVWHRICWLCLPVFKIKPTHTHTHAHILKNTHAHTHTHTLTHTLTHSHTHTYTRYLAANTTRYSFVTLLVYVPERQDHL